MVRSKILYLLFRRVILKNKMKMAYFFIPHSCMCIVESSDTEVSGASEVSQSRGKLFLGSPAAVFLLKH